MLCTLRAAGEVPHRHPTCLPSTAQSLAGDPSPFPSGEGELELRRTGRDRQRREGGKKEESIL